MREWSEIGVSFYSKIPISALFSWSGRRESNSQPTDWKSVTPFRLKHIATTQSDSVARKPLKNQHTSLADSANGVELECGVPV